MRICASCGVEVDVARDMSRRETCHSCGSDLHTCLNCRFYSDTAHNNCIESRAEHQRHRDKANFCDYFQYSEGKSESIETPTKNPLDDLFK